MARVNCTSPEDQECLDALINEINDEYIFPTDYFIRKNISRKKN